MKTTLYLTTLGLVCGLTAWAQATRADDRTALNDQQFVNMAATSGMAEVKLGRLAMDRSSNVEVKQFGQQLVKDHTQANQDLMKLAEKKNLKIPRNLDGRHQELIERFGKMRETDFDRQYIKQMVQDHQEAVNLFEREAKNGQDAELKTFAEKTLPTLRNHLRMAQALEAKQKGSR
jgi:putative membrane protein